ncbi:hypothetical protein NDY24_14725 [Xanthomonas hortorum pv. pelargonii]|nr:hypothetical protein NDY24_14725 [Xanthomonas hortorum pv. pelargonii]
MLLIGEICGSDQPWEEDQLAAVVGKGRQVGVSRIEQAMPKAQLLKRRQIELHVGQREIARRINVERHVAQHRQADLLTEDRLVGRLRHAHAGPG